MSRSRADGMGDASKLRAALEKLGESVAENGGRASRRASVRKPPKTESQPSFFAPALYDVGTKDSRSIMDVAVFRLSKKDKRPGDIIRYDMPDGFVQVSAGPAGMASVWDYDIVLMAVSHLTAATNRWRAGKGDKPGRAFRPNVAEILKFCRRGDGGKQHDDLVAALTRLSTTHVIVERTRKNRAGRVITVTEGEGLINRYRVVSGAATGKVDAVEIELPDWIYREVVEMERPDVLTVHPDYFLIEPGVGRFLYRLARRAAGRGEAMWSFRTIYEHSGSASSFKEFSRMLRKLVEADDLPEYAIAEQEGQGGPMLVMRHRSGLGVQCTDGSGQPGG